MAISKEEQLSIVLSHQKNLDFNAYNIAVSVIEENAKATPDSTILASLTAQTADHDAQAVALATELARVEAITE